MFHPLTQSWIVVAVVEGCGSGELAVEWMREALSGKMQWPYQCAGIDLLEMDIKNSATLYYLTSLQMYDIVVSKLCAAG